MHRITSLVFLLALVACAACRHAATTAPTTEIPPPSTGNGPALVLQSSDAYGLVTAIALSPAADRVAIGNEDGTVAVWDLERRLKVLDYHTQEGAIRGLAFGEDGRLAIVKPGLTCSVAPQQDAAAVECERHSGSGPMLPSEALREDEVSALGPRFAHGIAASVVDRDAGIAVVVSGGPHVVDLRDMSRPAIPVGPQTGTEDFGPMWGEWIGETSIAIGTQDSLWRFDLRDLSMRRLGPATPQDGPTLLHKWSVLHACRDRADPRTRVESSQRRHGLCLRDGAILDADGRTIGPSVRGAEQTSPMPGKPWTQALLSPDGGYLLESVSVPSPDHRSRATVEVWKVGGDRIWSGTVRGRPQLILADGRIVVWRPLPSDRPPGRDRLDLDVIGTDGRVANRIAIEGRGTPGSMTSSPDATHIFIGAQAWSHDTLQHHISQVSIETGEVVASFTGPRSSSSVLDVSPDGRWLLSNGFSGRLFVWNIATGARLTITTANPEWVVFDDEGHFNASRRGDKLLAAVSNGRGFPIRTAAVALNRPDLVLAQMGLGEAPAVAGYREAFAVRLRKLGLDESRISAAFSEAPRVNIEIVGAPQGRVAAVRLEAEASAGTTLAGYTILVNGVPVGRGDVASGSRIENEVVLEFGENRISAIVRDGAGLESIPDSRSVRIDGPPPARTLHVIGVGTSRYADRRLDLAYAAKDVRDVGEAVARHVGFDAVRTQILTDEEVTRGGLTSIAAFLAEAAVDDIVLMIVAGHGVHAGPDMRYHYLPHDVVVDDVPTSSWTFDEIEALLTATPARNRLLLLDTCESGERDGTGGPQHVEGARARTSRALVLSANGGAPSKTVDRESYLYNDILTRNGAIVLSSSTGTELSYELDALQNGVFTEAVLEALAGAADANADGALDTEELRRHVERRVPELTRGAQHPRLDRENRERTIVLPLRAPNSEQP